jgi:hypothetical protein
MARYRFLRDSYRSTRYEFPASLSRLLVQPIVMSLTVLVMLYLHFILIYPCQKLEIFNVCILECDNVWFSRW